MEIVEWIILVLIITAVVLSITFIYWSIRLTNNLKQKTAPKKQPERRKQTDSRQISIDQVWEQFHKTHDGYYHNLLMEHYRPLVKYTAERLHSKLPDEVELDDLISAGIFGLMDAIDAFNPGRGIKFETYCSPRIRGSILDELRSIDWVSLLQRDANAINLVSLNTEHNNKDIIKDEISEDPIIDTQKQHIKDFLKTLTRPEKLIVVFYYYEEMTIPEIAKVTEMSQPDVSLMLSSIITRCKSYLKRNENKDSKPKDD